MITSIKEVSKTPQGFPQTLIEVSLWEKEPAKGVHSFPLSSLNKAKNKRVSRIALPGNFAHQKHNSLQSGDYLGNNM